MTHVSYVGTRQQGLCPLATIVDMKQKMTKMKLAMAGLGAVATGLLVATIVLATTKNNNDTAPATAPVEDGKPDYGENPCFGMRPDLPNVQCLKDTEEIFSTGEQSGVNVTKGYNGNRNTTVTPITVSREIELSLLFLVHYLGKSCT